MSETTSPASALTPNQPAGALSIQQAAELLATRRTAAPAATTAPSAPEPPPQDETDKPETAPVEVEDADSTPDDTNEPEATEAEGAETDDEEPSGDYIETPDGEKIPVEEAVKAHQNFKALQARVTRKEQALAEERRTLEAERQKVSGELGSYLAQVKQEAEQIAAAREQYAQKLKFVSERFAETDPELANVNWDELEQTDPVEYSRKWTRYQRHEAAKAALWQEQQQIQAERERDMGRAVQQARSQFQAFVAEKYPELIDPEKGQSHQQAMLKTAFEAGYTENEIAQTLDPRAVVLWRKAALYDQMVAQKSPVSAKPTTAPKPDATGKYQVVKARAARPNPIPAPKAALGRAQAAFNANPTRENATALMEAKRISR
jgi:hypothetical protein